MTTQPDEVPNETAGTPDRRIAGPPKTEQSDSITPNLIWDQPGNDDTSRATRTTRPQPYRSGSHAPRWGGTGNERSGYRPAYRHLRSLSAAGAPDHRPL